MKDERNEVAINRIKELKEAPRFCLENLLRRQTGIIAVWYQDREPFELSEWDWDGGLFELNFVFDDTSNFSDIITAILKAIDLAEEKYASHYQMRRLFGYSRGGYKDFFDSLQHNNSYDTFIMNVGRPVYATKSFFYGIIKALCDSPAYIANYPFSDRILLSGENLLRQSIAWFSIADDLYLHKHYKLAFFTYLLSMIVLFQALYHRSKKKMPKCYDIRTHFVELQRCEPWLNKYSSAISGIEMSFRKLCNKPTGRCNPLVAKTMIEYDLRPALLNMLFVTAKGSIENLS